jgi:hypothetical protein
MVEAPLDPVLERAWSGLVAGTTGPLKFRFVLQPLVATVLALRAGLRDAREGRSPFLWALLTERGHRKERFARGLTDVGTVFLVAVLADMIDQRLVGPRVFPAQSLLVATILALVPYTLLCGPLSRLARWRRRRRTHAT